MFDASVINTSVRPSDDGPESEVELEVEVEVVAESVVDVVAESVVDVVAESEVAARKTMDS